MMEETEEEKELQVDTVMMTTGSADGQTDRRGVET
jgi:hypothetical protein